jgi:hypothetical protein
MEVFRNPRQHAQLRLALSKGPNWVGVFPPHLRTETDPLSKTCFLFSRKPDDGKSPKPSNSVIHNRQNPLESTHILVRVVSPKTKIHCPVLGTRLKESHVDNILSSGSRNSNSTKFSPYLRIHIQTCHISPTRVAWYRIFRTWQIGTRKTTQLTRLEKSLDGHTYRASVV